MSRQPSLLPPLQPQAYIRTLVPAIVGLLIAKLIVAIPFFGDLLAFIDDTLLEAGFAGVTAVGILNSVLAALVILAYYWIANLIARAYPALGKWLLGAEAAPVYVSSDDEVIFVTPAPQRTDIEDDEHDEFGHPIGKG